jgi:hypothetical protein
MATKKDKGENTPKKVEKEARKASSSSTSKKSDKKSNKAIYAVVIIAILAVAAIIIYSVSIQSNASVPFSTFKQNFNNAQRVSIASTYNTEGQFINESQCFSSIIQIVSHTRLPSTLDFYLINQTSCTYSKSGLGNQVTPITTNASFCRGRALNETGIFINYTGAGNYTYIEPQHMYIYGNSSYMRSCPIAADFA